MHNNASVRNWSGKSYKDAVFIGNDWSIESKLVCQSKAESHIFKTLALKIEETDKENVYLIFDVLSGSRKLQDAKMLIDTDLSSSLDKLEN